MKPSQKLLLTVESISVRVRYDDLDPKLIPLALRLEREGDIYGPVGTTIDNDLYVGLQYADKHRGPKK